MMVGMSEVRADYLTRFKPTSAEPLAERPVSVKLPQDIDALVRALPLPSEWLRQVICEAAQRDLINRF